MNRINVNEKYRMYSTFSAFEKGLYQNHIYDFLKRLNILKKLNCKCVRAYKEYFLNYFFNIVTLLMCFLWINEKEKNLVEKVMCLCLKLTKGHLCWLVLCQLDTS